MKKIKICGLTNIEDAQNAIDLGADYLGFIFADSPRKIEIEKVIDIIAKISKKNAKIVGVFMNQNIEYIQNIDKICNFDIIQLHGYEDIIKYKKKLKKPLIKRVCDIVELQYIKNIADYLLFDKTKKSGRILEFKEIQEYNITQKYFIAGGLNENNIVESLKFAQTAYGIDLSSGIEEKIGKKDYNKMQKVIEMVKKFEINQYKNSIF